jgi:hypothetical protein
VSLISRDDEGLLSSSAFRWRRPRCWSCGQPVLARSDASYTCWTCDVGQSARLDPERRRRDRRITLDTQRRLFKIDGWIDHGDPAQRRASPA